MKVHDLVKKYGWLSIIEIAKFGPKALANANVFFVDSGATNALDADDQVHGNTWDVPFATLDYAIGKCTDSQGDVILIAPGHVEDYDGTTTGFDADKIGITIIGLGSGSLRPRFDLEDASAGGVIGANDVTIDNIVIRPSVTAVLIGLDLESGVIGCKLTNIELAMGEDGAGVDEFVKGIHLTSGNHDTVIKDTKILAHASATEATHGIHIDAASDRLTFDNVIIDGPFATNGILEDAAGLNHIFVDCSVDVTGTNIAFNGSSTFAKRTRNLDGGGSEDTSENLIGYNDANNAVDTDLVVSNVDGSVLERLEYLQKLQEILTADQLRSVAGSSMPLAVWYVDPAATGGTGDGKSPANAFETIQLAIAACSNSVDDWILVFDYSGGGGTITMDKSFVHLIGNANKGMSYPRIKPASAVPGITFAATGDRVEIANLVIGGGDQTVPAISFPVGTAAGAYGNYIHDNVIGRDSDAPCSVGIEVVSGGAAPYLVVENNRFYGAAGSGIAAAGSAIKLAGNATRCQIMNNFISDVGRTATPAIWLSGSVTEPRIQGNRIKTDTDSGTGSAITLAAGVDDGWISDNLACDGKDDASQNPFLDGASTNGWAGNYNGASITQPA
ncbi:hypothetical protein LCGC14_0846220 [marine sediment metagenome]|uniref:Right handed beta helix domain-containing protein n=1 Tax=marine sediment metagenome TaxID=412755 RepID=A0A0F9PBK3_9ZZZZ